MAAMRIIAGEFRGRRLLPPAGDATRPITDRVKQSLFDILAPRLPDAVVYDCFAGTGSMGLESLSRCARLARFFERDRSAVQRLRQNIETLRLGDAAAVHDGDIGKFLKLCRPIDPADRAEVIFFDPPYPFLRERPAFLVELAEEIAAHHLAPGGVVTFRHDAADTLALDPLKPFDTRVYGGMALELLTVPTIAPPTGGLFAG
jgi:16S rRNA (guanine(966)-N(2))-methyltransferase RsmD